MRGLDPRIHLLAKKDGLHRTSGLPEVRTFKCRKSGKPDLRVKPGNDDRDSVETAFSKVTIVKA